ncbi:CidA/LrgA family protein [Paenibacillus ginsengarvi]|uniref:Holin n=1 Tax=Paenibacillus ginsengarvi TaxID=400777 RepID=A0A3B0BH54_9BACL|nr:CidA/LrgA family protein [Paenibacillus ginsengarvi]RKN71206.1 holin [Paenibacillus ginsengarvi]
MQAYFAIVRQIVVLIAFSYIGSLISALLKLPVSGSIVGLLLVFALLKLGVLRVEWLEAGANWLLSKMLLFFVPAAVGIIGHKELFGLSGIGFALVIGLGTVAVMGCSGVAAELISRRKEAAKR